MSEAPATDLEAGPLAAPAARAYYARVRGLLLTPTAEWGVIAHERPTPRQLFVRWVLPFSLFFFLAQQIGAIAFPHRFNGVAAAPSVVVAVYTVIVGTALMCGGVWALAWIVDAFAKAFGGKRDPAQAMKLAAYSGTGLWAAGAFGLIPAVDFLSALGIVSLYTLYRGLPVLMGAPEDRALPYAASVAAAAAVLGVVLMSLSSCFSIMGGSDAVRARVAQKAPVVAAAPAVAPRADPRAPLDPDKLRRLIPDAMPGGWVRAGLTRNEGGVLGFTGPTVEGVFENGPRRIVVQVVDLGPGRADAAIAALRNEHPAFDDDKGAIVHGAENGQYVYEETNRLTGLTRRLTVVGDRIALAAEGTGGVTPGDLRTALSLIDLVRVEQIARGL